MTNSASEIETVRVDLAERSYDILIGDGLLAEAGARIHNLFPQARIVIVTDDNVNAAHGDALRASLDSAGFDHHTIAVKAGEPSKSADILNEVVEGVLGTGLERNDVLIAFGGGVIGDLAGFAAGIVRRGMPFVQIPTSLLAQVDSSVGGKTGINSPHGKNLIGLFNQPALVLADTAVLDTLPERELRAGYAEIAKYGLIDQPDFFAWLETNYEQVFAGGHARRHAVATSCRAKAAVVAADETEQGQRALLNLGHTFGHALEAFVRYDASRLVHGEAVAIGMVLAHRFSSKLNHCGPEAAERVSRHLKAAGLPTSVGQIPDTQFTVDRLMQAIAQDKKVKRGALTFILTHGIGQSFVANDVAPSLVQEFLTEILAEA